AGRGGSEGHGRDHARRPELSPGATVRTLHGDRGHRRLHRAPGPCEGDAAEPVRRPARGSAGLAHPARGGAPDAGRGPAARRSAARDAGHLALAGRNRAGPAGAGLGPVPSGTAARMIGIEVLRPLWLLLLPLAPLAYLAWRRWPPPLQRGRGRLVLVSRILLMSLLVLALAGVRLTTHPTKRALVAVVDVSASVKSGSGLDSEAATVLALQASKGPDDLFGVVTFGHDGAVELPLTQNPQFDTFQTQPDPSYTDVAGALRLAAGLIPDGYARQLVLISDGQENLGDAATAVSALRAEGVRVDVLPVGGSPTAEALVSSVDVASTLRQGQVANVTVNLRSTGGAGGKLTLIVDGSELSTRDVTLPAGSSSQSFDVPGLAVGLH